MRLNGHGRGQGGGSKATVEPGSGGIALGKRLIVSHILSVPSVSLPPSLSPPLEVSFSASALA